jgi:hypothetical protein
MKPFVGHLPDAKKKEQFVEVFLDEFEQSGEGWLLDFMRLGVFARKILA